MFSRCLIASVFAVVAVSSARPEKPVDKQSSYIKVQIKGVLVREGDDKKCWAIKIAPAGGLPFSWFIGFPDKEDRALEKVARRLRNRTVIVSGELLYCPPMSLKHLSLDPLSSFSVSQFPAIHAVIAHEIRAADPE